MPFVEVNAGFIPKGGFSVNGSAQPAVCLATVCSASPVLEQLFDSVGTGGQGLS